jgi:16S rRNA (adenine1518-N6/adenine1519-N6)-dimethyltransferase
LGQNFITDLNLLRAIVGDAGVKNGDTVVEIGVGAGGLTLALSEVCGRVYGFEIDCGLKNILGQTLKGRQNVEIIFRDVLEMSDAELREIIGGGSFRVVANLPYYVAMPMIMRFLESGLRVESLTVMVQKEVAERVCARHNTKEYSSATLAVKVYADAKITRIVGRNAFFPVPNVDSALLRLDVVPDKYKGLDRAKFLKLTNAAFAMRRKTLANNLTAAFGIDKAAAESAIENAGFAKNVRGEALPIDGFIEVFKNLYAENI